MSIHQVLLIVALICFGIAATDRQVPRVNLLALGLMFWVLAILIP